MAQADSNTLRKTEKMKNWNIGNAENTSASLVSILEEKITRYSRVSHYVLITGERGTGKTTIARRLHEQSNRREKEFINLNCASLSQELLESELFGYEKGAFTGATAPKMGLFEIASGGTLFLDEIGEIPLNLQAKLLKAVEEKRIRRVGSNTERAVDTRIVAATSQDLKRMVAGGRFRADLYDRLNILNLETVPLRFQREKIKDLFASGLESECEGAGRALPFEISDEAVRLVEAQDWLGNFRELNNFVTRLAIECLDESIILEDSVRRVLSERIKPAVPIETAQPAMRVTSGIIRHDYQSSEEDDLITVTFDPKFDDLDAVYLKAAAGVILHVLAENDGSLRRAASKLGATHSTLTRILQKFDSIYGTVSLHSHLDSVQNFAAVA